MNLATKFVLLVFLALLGVLKASGNKPCWKEVFRFDPNQSAPGKLDANYFRFLWQTTEISRFVNPDGTSKDLPFVVEHNACDESGTQNRVLERALSNKTKFERTPAQKRRGSRVRSMLGPFSRIGLATLVGGPVGGSIQSFNEVRSVGSRAVSESRSSEFHADRDEVLRAAKIDTSRYDFEPYIGRAR